MDKVISTDGTPIAYERLGPGQWPRRCPVVSRAVAGHDVPVQVFLETGDFLGWFHFRPPPGGPRSDGTVPEGVELGYRLRRSSWGNGYATQDSGALIRYGFTELGVERVYAKTMAVNAGSRRVPAVRPAPRLIVDA